MPQKLFKPARPLASVRHFSLVAALCLSWIANAVAFSGLLVSPTRGAAHPVVHHLARYAARAAAAVQQKQTLSPKLLRNAVVKRTGPGKHAVVLRRFRRDGMGGFLVYGALPQKRGSPFSLFQTKLVQALYAACPSTFVCPSFASAPSRAPPLV